MRNAEIVKQFFYIGMDDDRIANGGTSNASITLSDSSTRTEYEYDSYKKPRKSKKNLVTSLTAEQKAENQALSKIRIFVEKAWLYDQ